MGVDLFAGENGRKNPLIAIPAKGLVAFTLWTVVGQVDLKTVEIVSRLSIGLPGSLLAGVALIVKRRELMEQSISTGVCAPFALGLGIIAFGFFAELMYDPGSFYNTVHIPVQVFRTVCATMTFYAVFAMRWTVGTRLLGILLPTTFTPLDVSGIAANQLYGASSQGILLGIAVLTLLFSVTIIVFVSRSVSSQATLVARAMKAVSIGDVQGKIETKSADVEFGEMFRYINDACEYHKEMAHVADTLSKGNLTVNIAPKSDQDILGISLVAMVNNLRRIGEQINNSSASVAKASAHQSSVINQIESAASQACYAIEQVASGSETQAQAVSETSEQVANLASQIERISRYARRQEQGIGQTSDVVANMSMVIEKVSDDARNVEESSASASVAAQNGASAVAKTIDGMEAIKATVKQSAARIKDLGDRSAEIGKIVEVIDDIAEQTNLLALNAAIEAARAGEHGKGFAVVADEVRKLAERSSRATKEIASLITAVQRDTNIAVKAMEEGATNVEVGSSLAADAGHALSQIIEAVETTNHWVKQISAGTGEMISLSSEVASGIGNVFVSAEKNKTATTKMSAHSQDVVVNVNNLARIGENNSAAAEQLAAMIAEVSEQIKKIVASSESLEHMAVSLKEGAKMFIVEDDAPGQVELRRRKSDWKSVAETRAQEAVTAAR